LERQGKRIKPVKQRKATLKYNKHKVVEENGYSGIYNMGLERQLQWQHQVCRDNDGYH